MSSATPYTPPDGDISIQMLREIFGSAFSSIFGSGNTGPIDNGANMLGVAFGYFNSSVLFFGALILLWVTVIGINNTALDGELLGKRWSTFYTPMRSLTASFMLIPGASGFSAIQFLILLFVSYSIGFASNMWGGMVDYVLKNQASQEVMSSIHEDTGFDNLAWAALRMKVCGFATTTAVNQISGSNPVNLQLYFDEKQSGGMYGLTKSFSKTYTTTIGLRDPNWPHSEDICGKIVLTSTYQRPETNSSASQDVAMSIRNTLNTTRYNYMNELLRGSELNDTAQLIVETATNPTGKISAQDVSNKIVNIRKKLMTQIEMDIKNEIYTKNDELAEKFKENGWAYAGSLHRELARIQDAVKQSTNAKSEFTPGTGMPNLPGTVGAAISNAMSPYESLMAAIESKANTSQERTGTTGRPTVPSLQSNFSASDFADGGGNITSIIKSYFNSVTTYLLNGLLTHLADKGADPVMQVKNIGDWMATMGESIIISKYAATLGLSALEKTSDTAGQTIIGAVGDKLTGIPSAIKNIAKFLTDVIKETWSHIWPGVYSILYAGYFLGIWIPMVPFYIFALGVIGWLVQVGESLAAGALWMMMHLTPAREDSFIGSETQGYLLLTSLFFKPPLMILGLVFSLSILSPATRYINESFMLAIRVNQTDSMTGILSIAGYMLLYCFIIYSVFMLVFALPQSLPDRILRWVNAGTGDLGEQNSQQRIESGASHQARTAAGVIANKQAQRNANRLKDIIADDNQRDNASANSPEGHAGDSAKVGESNTGTKAPFNKEDK